MEIIDFSRHAMQFLLHSDSMFDARNHCQLWYFIRHAWTFRRSLATGIRRVSIHGIYCCGQSNRIYWRYGWHPIATMACWLSGNSMALNAFEKIFFGGDNNLCRFWSIEFIGWFAVHWNWGICCSVELLPEALRLTRFVARWFFSQFS